MRKIFSHWRLEPVCYSKYLDRQVPINQSTDNTVGPLPLSEGLKNGPERGPKTV